MEILAGLIDLVVHLDQHLRAVAQDYGALVYLLLFSIIFCETGLVVTPFLPGDSLLFVAGTLAAADVMNVHALALLLILAAVLGNTVNYTVGRWIGPRVFRFEDSWLFRRAYLERTHRYFERYGGRTIVITRFVPIVRTYAPFVAGIGGMTYARFLLFNVTGAVLWAAGLIYAGYFFGNLPIIKDNLSLVILFIVLVSIAPGILELARHKLRTAAPGRSSD